MALLDITDLKVSVDGKDVLKGIDLAVDPGKVVVIMGPNGSGKSTLANTLAGHPKYSVTGGQISFRGSDLLALRPDERARQGVFLSFQYPKEIPGVSMSNFLRLAWKSVHGKDISVFDFHKKLRQAMEVLQFDQKFADRNVNEGFSGGEKKKAEILQAMMLEPTLLMLDEMDSGLDVDALKVVAEGVGSLRQADRAILLVTHYMRILDYLRPDEVHVMKGGRIVESGGPELADKIEREGFTAYDTDEASGLKMVE